MDYWTTPEAHSTLMKHLGLASDRELYEMLHIDHPHTVAPNYVGPHIPANEDEYGVEYRVISYGLGTYREAVTAPLAQYGTVEEIEANYRWPDPDWWDYSNLSRQLVGWEDWPIGGGNMEAFLIYKNLRGQEQAFMDLALNPEIAKYCLGRLFDIKYADAERIMEAIPGKLTFTYFGVDLGAQNGLLMSRRQINRFLMPGIKRIIDLAHDHAVYAFFHTDGGVRDVLPDLIEAGIDLLNPIQWRCATMEREALKADFGDEVVMHGGMDNQYTLAFGSVDEVKEEVAYNLRVLGRDGGYILAPCHNIQPVTPPENTVAMYETGYELGWNN